MNTGHKGLMSSIHANSCKETLPRLALLFSIYSDYKNINFDQILKLILDNLDYIIYIENKKIKNIYNLNE